MNVKRKFIIGDEWLYFKIYSGPKTADNVLTEIIKPISEALLNENIIDKWFYIRYADPDLHTRVRFRLLIKENIGKIILLLNNYATQYIEDGLIWKIQTDTYNRELERYGDNTIELSEELFFHDSNMLVNVLDLIEGDEGEIIRWLFSLRSVDAILNDFNYSEEQKIVLTNMLSEGYGREFNMNKSLKRQLDNKFRRERESINEVMNSKNDKESEMLPLFQLLFERTNKIIPIAEDILKLKEQNKLLLDVNNLLISYIHMTLNRTFKSKQRVHELVLYYFLNKYNKSEFARKKYSKKNV